MPGPVFISYARADDISPPDDANVKGWVTHFWGQLRFELTDRGAEQAELWLDRYQIEPQEAFTGKIESALAEAKLIVTILSKNWIKSDWCRRELEIFDHIHEDASDRFIPILKNELKRELLPALMQDHFAREGYKFFKIKDTGKTDEFYWRGMRDREAYYELIKEIAEFIIEKLYPTQLPPILSPILESSKTVFIALTDSDLHGARQRLVNDLKAEGIAVVPEDKAIPETIEEFERFVKDALSKAELSIHLLGEKQEITVGGSKEPIVDYQMRLARETELPRVFCISYLLNPDEIIKNRIGNLSEQEEIFGENITSLSQWLRKRLKPMPSNIESSLAVKFQQILVAAAHPDDKELAIKLARNLQGYGLTINWYLAGNQPPSELQRTVTLIPWGHASETNIQTLSTKLSASTQVICLLLPEGNEIAQIKTAKNLFFQNDVVTQEVTLPKNRQEGRQLLESLEILPIGGDKS